MTKHLAGFLAIMVGTLILLTACSDIGITNVNSGCDIRVTEGTIQPVINDASPGSVVCLTHSQWKENLILDKDITLTGNKTSIYASEISKPIIEIIGTCKDGNNLFCENPGDHPLEITVENITLGPGQQKCEMTINSGSPCPQGIITVRNQANIRMKEVTLIENGAAGIDVQGDASLDVRQSRLINNGLPAIIASGSATVSISDSQISENGGGILAWDSSSINVSNSTVSYNDTLGIVATNDTDVMIRGSDLLSNSYSGLSAEEAAEVHLTRSRINNNGNHGLILMGNPNVTIRDSEIKGNIEWGVKAALPKCGSDEANFNGEVLMEGDNTITNNGSGDVCLPNS